VRARGRRLPHGQLRPAALRRPVTVLVSLLAAAAIAYAAIAGAVWFGQERLLFYPQPIAATPIAPPGWRLERIEHRTADGAALRGVLLLPRGVSPPLVVYYGGNAEEVTAGASDVANEYGERAVLLVNYRAYGDSTGTPSEKTLVEDALAILDRVRTRTDIDASRVALHGRSLGSGVAVQVAASRPVSCVILTSPFDSALDVARAIYGWLPVGLLMRHPFDSLARAPQVHVPALVLVGAADTLIPPSHSRRLADAWGGPVERVILEGTGHNDVHLHAAYAPAIRGFLERCA
jgi:uncharacterized protein